MAAIFHGSLSSFCMTMPMPKRLAEVSEVVSLTGVGKVLKRLDTHLDIRWKRQKFGYNGFILKNTILKTH